MKRLPAPVGRGSGDAVTIAGTISPFPLTDPARAACSQPRFLCRPDRFPPSLQFWAVEPRAPSAQCARDGRGLRSDPAARLRNRVAGDRRVTGVDRRRRARLREPSQGDRDAAGARVHGGCDRKTRRDRDARKSGGSRDRRAPRDDRYRRIGRRVHGGQFRSQCRRVDRG